MSTKLAFAGFRHGHILDLYNRAAGAEDIEITGACEEDRATREALAAEGRITITHDSLDAMLAETECDAVAVGDYYAGPSHVLPVGGTARIFGPLNVNDFLKQSSIVSYDLDALEKAAPDIAKIADAEGLDAHKRSIEIRVEK